jgi:hypothetical protein
MERDPTTNKSRYTINSYFLVFNDQLPCMWQLGMTFMQDNTSIYIAKKIKKWFTDKAILVMDWPLYSPDLNPIKHL